MPVKEFVVYNKTVRWGLNQVHVEHFSRSFSCDRVVSVEYVHSHCTHYVRPAGDAFSEISVDGSPFSALGPLPGGQCNQFTTQTDPTQFCGTRHFKVAAWSTWGAWDTSVHIKVILRFYFEEGGDVKEQQPFPIFELLILFLAFMFMMMMGFFLLAIRLRRRESTVSSEEAQKST